jgi:hypothetical protein
VKEKRFNAAKMVKQAKKMNAKLKASLEKKQIVRAVQALLSFSKRSKEAGAAKNLLEDEDQFIQVTFTLT